MRKLGLFFVLISSGAFAATCPDGYTPVDWPANIKLSAACAANTIDLGVVPTTCDDVSETCTLGLLCRSKHKIMTSAGVQATLYSSAHTTPAMHLSLDGERCYANLVPGSSGDALHVRMDDAVYHTADLHQCRVKVDENTPIHVEMIADYSVSWFGTVGDVNFTAWALCSSDWGTSGSSKRYPGVSTTTTDNKYCWCRMVMPAVSSWVFAETMSDTSNCETSCAQSCAFAFMDNATFRTTIISGFNAN